MLLAMADNKRIAGALLNDIGPVLETKGLEHIRSYVGRSQSWPTWLHAARFLREAQSDRYPDWDIGRWLVYAKRLCKLTPSGRIVFDYDMRIAEPFKAPGGDTGFDLWTAFAGLKGVPSLVVHGELSDLLEPGDGRADAGGESGDGGGDGAPCRPCADAGRAGGGGGDRPAAGAGDVGLTPLPSFRDSGNPVLQSEPDPRSRWCNERRR